MACEPFYARRRTWIARAGSAIKVLRPNGRFKLVGVEADKLTFEWMVQHMQNNNVRAEPHSGRSMFAGYMPSGSPARDLLCDCWYILSHGVCPIVIASSHQTVIPSSSFSDLLSFPSALLTYFILSSLRHRIS